MDEKQVMELARKQGAELVQTHISWVLIADKEVFKIKKPVKFSFLDFSTLERRKMFCEEEVRLNRRMSPDVYLGVVPITDERGVLAFGGTGKALDYAVRMKKLDRELMMDKLVMQGKLGKEDMAGLAAIVAEFHAKAEIVKGEFGSPALIKAQIADLGNHRDAIEKACRLGKWVDDILSRSELFLKKNDALLKRRVAQGHIRDCHGDLHTRNVFFQDGIRIVDCIEFSRDFRCIDVASDIAFMAMDLDYCGREDLARAFVDAYAARSRDEELEALLPIYKCYRANVRAKIAAIEWQMGGGKEEERQRIDRYTLLAAKYARGL
ncbi:MAG: phosphotransferase [Candidatus Micrarchaeota archaeon]